MRSSIQRASAGGTRWTVPRIGQVRIASRRSSAALTSASVNPGRRTPRDQSALAMSWACIAPNHSTTPATVSGLALGCTRSSRLVIRIESASATITSTGVSLRAPTDRKGGPEAAHPRAGR
jgi:hypothetical protein